MVVSSLRVLVVEDDPSDFEAIERLLAKTQGWRPLVERADSFDEGAAQLQRKAHDIYLIDYLLDKGTGLDLLSLARELEVEKPIIMLIGDSGGDVGPQVTASGASDYIEKADATAEKLERSIRYAIKHKETDVQLQAHTRELMALKEKLDLLTQVSENNRNTPLAPTLHALSIPTGTLVKNYRVIKLIGRGGMGSVYLAEHTRLKRKAALKFFLGDLDEEPDAMKRFEREAMAISSVNHPNIITIYDIDLWGRAPYIAMEYVEGVSAKVLFENQGILPLDISLNLIAQLAEGLLQTHRAAVVHRDIKPANLMIDPSGYLKILDFGLAKLIEASRITQSEHTLGTAYYVAPEMFLGKRVDHRADIWAAGVLLYQMLTGTLPFGEKNIHRVMYAVLNKTPVPVHEKNPDLPEPLQDIIDKCLHKNPEHRYHAFSEMIDDLFSVSSHLEYVFHDTMKRRVAAFMKQRNPRLPRKDAFIA